MRFFLVILSLISFFDFSGLAVCQSVVLADESDLFLVRVSSIDRDKHEMFLKMVDGDKNINENFVYVYESLPESIKPGDLIRIWGTIDRNIGRRNTKTMDLTQESDATKDVDKSDNEKSSELSGNKIAIAGTISGVIAGTSYKPGDNNDPTGVRKRLQRRIMSPHQPPARGAGRGQP